MSFEIYLNGSLVASPKDWDGYEQEIVRDYKKRFLRIAYPGTFTLTNASGYPALRALLLDDLCSIVRFEAYEVCGLARYQIVNGYVVIADAEWNLNDCTCEIEVQDDAIGARVDNNVRIPVSPLADKSKNGVDITPCPTLSIEVFDPSDDAATYLPDARTMYDWLDAMTHCIQYITDSNIAVTSAWYEALDDTEKVALCNGYQLRTADIASDAKRLTYDFQTLWLEVAKRYNLWIAVKRNDSGVSYLAIEPEPDMFSTSQPLNLLHQYELVQSIDRDQLYSAVEVGDEEGIQNLDLTYSLPYLVLQGFSQEKFHFQGTCNTDEVLDLTGKWHADTNTIEKVLVTDPTSDDYDKDTFLIQYNAYTNKAVKGDYLVDGSTPYLYNEQMLNVNILNRYTLPSDVGSYYDSSDSGFMASGNGPQGWGAVTAPVIPGTCFYYPFGSGLTDTDVTTPPNNNVDGNWDVALQRYTAPAQGFYEFEVYMQMSVDSSAPAGIDAVFERYDSGNVLLATQTVQVVSSSSPGTYIGSNTASFVLNAGDYVTRTYRRFICRGNVLGADTATIQPLDHYTRTRFIAAGGGVLTNIDTDAARIVKHKFERLIPVSEWQQYVNDPSLGIGVSHTGGAVKSAHIQKATRDVVSGRTTYELISKKDVL